MHYNTSVVVRSQESLDFEAAKSTLLPNEFVVENSSNNNISFTGKGMRSTNQPAIRGATKIKLEYKAGSLHLDAKLGGVLFMALFLLLFPPALFITLSLTTNTELKLMELGIWLVISPILVIWVKSRTIKALNELLRSVMQKDKFA